MEPVLSKLQQAEDALAQAGHAQQAAKVGLAVRLSTEQLQPALILQVGHQKLCDGTVPFIHVTKGTRHKPHCVQSDQEGSPYVKAAGTQTVTVEQRNQGMFPYHCGSCRPSPSCFTATLPPFAS